MNYTNTQLIMVAQYNVHLCKDFFNKLIWRTFWKRLIRQFLNELALFEQNVLSVTLSKKRVGTLCFGLIILTALKRVARFLWDGRDSPQTYCWKSDINQIYIWLTVWLRARNIWYANGLQLMRQDHTYFCNGPELVSFDCKQLLFYRKHFFASSKTQCDSSSWLSWMQKVPNEALFDGLQM